MEIFSKFKNSGASNINGIPVKVPKSYEGILPINNKNQFDFEPYTFLALKNSVKNGFLVFDIGSSYGVMSVLMANLVGEKGKVFSFEANPEVAKRSQELISKNNMAEIINVKNFLVCDLSNQKRDFYTVPDLGSVASSLNPSIKKIHPSSSKIAVPTIKIDDFCNQENYYPQCLKIDVEGAEFLVIEGMKNFLQNYTPEIVLETHGPEINGIGGSLEELLEKLASYGYGFFDLEKGEVVSMKEFVARYNSSNSTVYASTKFKEPQFAQKFQNDVKEEVMLLAKKKLKKIQLEEIKNLINNEDYEKAYEQLKILPLDSSDAEKQYYLALSLHVLGKNNEEALSRYTKSLELGFDPFWIYYNRGFLLMQIGDKEQASNDIKKAEKINSSHPGIIKAKKELSLE